MTLVTERELSYTAPIVSELVSLLTVRLLDMENDYHCYRQNRPFARTLTRDIDALEAFLASGERLSPTSVSTYANAWYANLTELADRRVMRGAWAPDRMRLIEIQHVVRQLFRSLIGPDERITETSFEHALDDETHDPYPHTTQFFIFITHHVNGTLPLPMDEAFDVFDSADEEVDA